MSLENSNCENEPIRFSGAVMPHGVLIVLQAGASLAIEAVSESSASLLGLPAETLLGKSFDQIFGAEAAVDLATAKSDDLRPILRFSLNGKALLARISTNGAGQTLVDVEVPVRGHSNAHAIAHDARRELTRLRQLADVPSITQALADGVRRITAFERVMVYRFDPEWNGEVVAEARIEGIEPYLGLNYPASDIPRQARELYLLSKLRTIPDVKSLASTLVAQSDAHAIDLGQSALRSVSPMHIEYLRNMGVHATLSCALVVEGRLWGLVACHHISAPNHLDPQERETLEWFCQDAAALIEATLIRQQRERVQSLAMRRQKLAEAVGASDLRTLMHPGRAIDLLDVVGADGFALIDDNRIHTVGGTPTAERIRELQRRRRQSEKDPTLFASTALTRDLGVEDVGDGVAGAIFVSVRERPEVSVIWFRKERRYSVRWAGDPDQAHTVDESGHISPRKSFAQFLKNIRGECLTWDPEELASAAELGTLIQIDLLRKSEAFNKTTLTSMPEQLAVLNHQGVIVAVNKAWERFAGENGAPELVNNSIGLNYLDTCNAATGQPPGDEASAARKGIEAVLARRLDHFTLEYPCHSPTEQRWFQMTVAPMMAPGDGVVVVHQNVTPQRLLQNRLDHERTRLRVLLDTIPDLVWQKDIAGRYVTCNPEYQRFLGAEEADIVCKTDYDFLDKPTADLFLQQDADVIAAGSTLVHENAITYASDGHRALVEAAKTPLRDADGNIYGILGIARDITDRVLLEAENSLLSTAMKQSSAGIMITDANGLMTFVNQAVTMNSGYQADELIGKNPGMMKSGLTPDKTYAEMWSTISSGKAWAGVFCNKNKYGELYWESTQITPVKDKSGRIISYIAVKDNVTKMKQAETLLAEAKNTAEAATAAKSAFLANMSHEIRTPLNGILGSAALLKRRIAEPYTCDLVSNIARSAEHLLSLINDILDFSKIESGKLDIARDGFNLAATVLATCRQIEPLADAKGLAINVELAEGLPEAVNGDALRIRQCLLNYLSNAIKFTERGIITMRVKAGAGKIRFEVEDSGRGIPVTLQGRLFESFQQADNSISRSHGGTGLGLAITRSLAMMMGGEAGFRSCPGEGSLFWFEIPLDIVASALSIGPRIDVVGSVQEVERILSERHRKARLLLVEDDQINRETVLWMLTEVGMTADIAFNGRDAVRIVQEKCFDLILMDMQMPEMDGLEATRSIRQIPERGAVPIVALTANAFEQDQRACRDAGMNDFLSKPMMPEDLYAMLLKWLGDSTAAPVAVPWPTETASPSDEA